MGLNGGFGGVVCATALPVEAQSMVLALSDTQLGAMNVAGISGTIL
jgi:hypothetical protein